MWIKVLFVGLSRQLERFAFLSLVLFWYKYSVYRLQCTLEPTTCIHRLPEAGAVNAWYGLTMMTWQYYTLSTSGPCCCQPWDIGSSSVYIIWSYKRKLKRFSKMWIKVLFMGLSCQLVRFAFLSLVLFWYTYSEYRLQCTDSTVCSIVKMRHVQP